MSLLSDFRRSMSLLHTWAGLPVSWVLFIVFLTGSITYFNSEISVWMQPEIHTAGKGLQGIDNAFSLLLKNAEKAETIDVYLPDARRNTILAWWLEADEDDSAHKESFSLQFDPASGEIITPRKTDSGFLFYRMHYGRYGIGYTGVQIVYSCAMVMLIALISGIVIHRTLIKDFFTFRPGRGRLSWRDVHNASSVLALPFHLVLCFSSLLIAFWFYFPSAVQARYGEDVTSFYKEAFLQNDIKNIAPTEKVADKQMVTSLKPLLAESSSRWQGQGAERIRIDKNKYIIEVCQSFSGELKLRDAGECLVFDLKSGELTSIKSPKEPSFAAGAWNTMYSIHVGRFASPLLRFLLFSSGLIGALMFASGLFLWTDRHKPKKPNEKPTVAFTIVSVCNISVISGIFVAIGAYFWSNRLISSDLEARSLWEVHVFSIVWGCALVHAILRRTHLKAWMEQFFVAGLLFLFIPVLNGLTGGAHLGVSIQNGLWIVAGFDIVAFLFGVIFLAIAFKLGCVLKKDEKAEAHDY